MSFDSEVDKILLILEAWSFFQCFQLLYFTATHPQIIPTSKLIEEEYTPQLFSEENSTEQNLDVEKTETHEQNRQEEELFDQTVGDEEDFEIPAFLRRQKF